MEVVNIVSRIKHPISSSLWSRHRFAAGSAYITPWCPTQCSSGASRYTRMDATLSPLRRDSISLQPSPEQLLLIPLQAPCQEVAVPVAAPLIPTVIF